MALKDWKKDDSQENWKSIYARQTLFVRKDGIRVISISRYESYNHKNDSYDVNLIGSKRTSNLANFKTKAKALAYAKAYMRKH